MSFIHSRQCYRISAVPFIFSLLPTTTLRYIKIRDRRQRRPWFGDSAHCKTMRERWHVSKQQSSLCMAPPRRQKRKSGVYIGSTKLAHLGFCTVECCNRQKLMQHHSDGCGPRVLRTKPAFGGLIFIPLYFPIQEQCSPKRSQRQQNACRPSPPGSLKHRRVHPMWQIRSFEKALQLICQDERLRWGDQNDTINDLRPKVKQNEKMSSGGESAVNISGAWRYWSI